MACSLLVYAAPVVAAPIVGCVVGGLPKNPNFCPGAVPIWVPTVLPSVMLTPSAHEPTTLKHWRLSVMLAIVLDPATTVASRTCGLVG